MGGCRVLNPVNRTPTHDSDWIGLTKVAILFFALAGIYLLAQSLGLDDYDSVQFAMGVHQFDVWRHQPHPPGYPLYIWLGQLGTKLFGASPIVSLNFFSALGGALFVAMWFMIVRCNSASAAPGGSPVVSPLPPLSGTRTDPLAAGLLSTEILAAL